MSIHSADNVLKELTDYVLSDCKFSYAAFETAKIALLDTIGCAYASLSFPGCTKLLGPIVPGTSVPNGARVIGTPYQLDPMRATFCFGTMLRFLDYNDTWLAAEWGHPSDNLGAILPLADWLGRSGGAPMPLEKAIASTGGAFVSAGSPRDVMQRSSVPTVADVLDAMIRAYEIQGILSLSNSLNRHGFDHVLFPKVASAGICAKLLGANEDEVLSAISNAFLDAPLRTYRHAPNTGSRKSWAAADATSRGLMFAWMAMQGEMGYGKALSAPAWGVQDVLFGGAELTLSRPLDSYVMEHILFKVSYPAEFHAQTALEAAIQLHPRVAGRIHDIEKITIRTHESALRIIDKRGPLQNPADRDHCIQYIVAIGLLKGNLVGQDYTDETAADERIDWLRSRMVVAEEEAFSRDYLNPDKRSIASSLTIQFANGEELGPVTIEYPLGHPARRKEALPKLQEKFTRNVGEILGGMESEEAITTMFGETMPGGMKVAEFISLLWSTDDWILLPVNQFIDLFQPKQA